MYTAEQLELKIVTMRSNNNTWYSQHQTICNLQRTTFRANFDTLPEV